MANVTAVSSPTCTPQDPYNPLNNSIINAALVYGLDESTQKALHVQDDGSLDANFESVLKREFRLQFLQVIAPGGVFPPKGQSTKQFTPACTPSSDTYTSIPEGVWSKAKKFRMEDVGLLWDTVNTLQYFMYPDGAYIEKTESTQPTMLPMLLTNIDGCRSYAVGLKFTRPFFIQKPSDSKHGVYHYTLIPYDPTDNSTASPENSKLVYVPTCIVLVSRYPLFHLMKQALSGLYRLINMENADFWSTLRDAVERVFLVPCLPEGSLAMKVQLPGFVSPTVVFPPRDKDNYLDARHNIPFLCLSVDNILDVLAALLTEQTIIFTSSNYALTPIVIQCFLKYMYPFEWRHQIVPILPTDQIDLLGAPGIVIIGCHSKCQKEQEFKAIEDAVIVRLDDDVVESKLTYMPSYPKLPAGPVFIFKAQLQQYIRHHYDITCVSRLELESAVERERAKLMFSEEQDAMLSAMFLELNVRIFDLACEKLLQGRAVYDEEIQALSEQDQFFYKYATRTDMFSILLSNRRKGQRDNFSVIADRIKRMERRHDDSFLETSFLLTGPRPSQAPADILNTVPLAGYLCTSNSKELQYLEIPPLLLTPFDKGSHLRSVIAKLNDLKEDKDIQGPCLNLLGYYSVAIGKLMEAMDIFYDKLEKVKVSLKPSSETLLFILSLLNNEEKELLQEQCYYKHLVSRRLNEPAYNRHMSHSGPRPVGGMFKKAPLNHNDFLKEVKQENIAKDAESAGSLFSVLQSVGHSPSVSPENFATFLTVWKQVQQECDAVSQISLIKTDVEECVLAVAGDLKTNVSAHCEVFLTTHRIIIKSSAISSHRTLAELNSDLVEAGSFCKTDIRVVMGANLPAIKVECNCQRSAPVPTDTIMVRKKTARSDPYIAFPNLLMRDVWYKSILEVVHGWKYKQARRDPAVMQLVHCHVRMIMTLYHTGWMNNEDHATISKWHQKLMGIQSKPITVDPGVIEALQYRVNPNIYQTEKATIESTLIVPPQDENESLKLWLGLGNGSIRVYDMEAKCFDSDVKIVDQRKGKTVRVSCLLLVGEHVWVGSLSKTIHILDVKNLCHVSQLSFLDDDPRDLALSVMEPCIVWVLLLNGVLLGFDPETRDRVSRIQVPNMTQHSFCTCFTIWRNTIWVGTNRGSITIVDCNTQSLLQEIHFPASPHRQVDIKYLAVSSENEIWCSVHSLPRKEDSTFITVFEPRSHIRLFTYSKLESSHRVSFILPVANTMWCGSKSGKIYVFPAKTDQGITEPKILTAHDDKVRSMTATNSGLVISGSGSKDGYANVWKLLPDWFPDT